MPISKEDDKSSWEQYHIILLSHIVLYWIWSLLDSDASLVVTRVSPPIFSLQHCCRFRKRMQLNVGGLWLNTLFLYYLFHHLFLYFLFFLQFPFLMQFIFVLFLLFLFLFSPSACVDLYWLVLVSKISTSFHVPHASNKGNVHQDWAFDNEVMPISKEDDKSSSEQYHIILLSHIYMYWI